MSLGSWVQSQAQNAASNAQNAGDRGRAAAERALNELAARFRRQADGLVAEMERWRPGAEQLKAKTKQKLTESKAWVARVRGDGQAIEAYLRSSQAAAANARARSTYERAASNGRVTKYEQRQIDSARRDDRVADKKQVHRTDSFWGRAKAGLESLKSEGDRLRGELAAIKTDAERKQSEGNGLKARIEAFKADVARHPELRGHRDWNLIQAVDQKQGIFLALLMVIAAVVIVIAAIIVAVFTLGMGPGTTVVLAILVATAALLGRLASSAEESLKPQLPAKLAELRAACDRAEREIASGMGRIG